MMAAMFCVQEGFRSTARSVFVSSKWAQRGPCREGVDSDKEAMRCDRSPMKQHSGEAGRPGRARVGDGNGEARAKVLWRAG